VCDDLNETHGELCTAVDADYPAIEKRAAELEQQMKSLPEEVQALCGEYSDLLIKREGVRQIAWFNLCFQAAIRLLGEPPEMHVVEGGATQRKRVAS
jgi:hypothetical protein